MKAIVLHQPYATLMALGEKQIETRTWEYLFRGPLAICAAKAIPAYCRELFHEEPFITALARNSITAIDDLPLGCVVAVVDFFNTKRTDDFVPHEDDWGEFEASFGNYNPGRFAWLTTNARRLTIPLPVRGGQRIFNVNGVCRVCACTEKAACVGDCYWVEPDLCRACSSEVQL